MPAKTKEKEERKLTLSAGDPEAGYVSPDRSLVDGVELFDDETQEAHDEAIAAHEDEVEAVAEHEDKVARERIAQAEKEAKGQAKEQEKAASTAATSSAKS